MENPFEALKNDLETLKKDVSEIKAAIVQQTATASKAAEMPPYLSKKEAAKLLGCSVSKIANLAREGKIKRLHLGGCLRFDRTELLSLVSQSQNTRRTNNR